MLYHLFTVKGTYLKTVSTSSFDNAKFCFFHDLNEDTRDKGRGYRIYCPEFDVSRTVRYVIPERPGEWVFTGKN